MCDVLGLGGGWVRVARVVLLVASIVHLLGCAHGPGASPVDALPVPAPSAAAVVQDGLTVEGVAQAAHDQAHCADDGVGTVRQQPAFGAPCAVVAVVGPDLAAVGGGRRGHGTVGPGVSPARERAVLGVWRI
ncbi:hypothetical protein DZF91_02145 [Actinomadura logoneensis]|uniref:Uncharacterized protein n=1 Tax=Actinomadura logoneensis TaxID=2293572 RepID=A0A372JTJ7_9ACTN|nr:hypothetical protein DZF91_02145 [Actinomadura logoneensis]